MKRYFKTLFFCALLPLIFSACSNLIVSDDKSQNGDQLSSDGKVAVTFGINDGISRSAFPTFETADLTSILINYYQGDSSEGELVGSWDSYADMRKSSFAFKPGSCYFEIYAAIQDNCFYDKKPFTIAEGNNSVNFSPVLLNVEDLQGLQVGMGSVKINLSYPPTNVAVVTGGLYTLDGDPVPGFYDRPLAKKDDGNVSYQKSNVPCGMYLVTFKFYYDTEKTGLMGTYREYAYIAANLTSASNCVLQALEGLYTITLNFNGGALKANQTFTEKYTRHTDDITLPEPIKSGYVFDGWYEKPDFSDARVYGIPSGSTGEKVFYAKWTEADKVTVTFYANGGSITTREQEMSKGTLTALMTAAELGLSAPSGRTFLGWAESATDTEAAYLDGQYVRFSSDNTLSTPCGRLALLTMTKQRTRTRTVCPTTMKLQNILPIPPAPTQTVTAGRTAKKCECTTPTRSRSAPSSLTRQIWKLPLTESPRFTTSTRLRKERPKPNLARKTKERPAALQPQERTR
ncbi:MAG: InlB B-repeat-containing protein [Treponema sp.]|nr:InlB B-repeat-containing protein [Treponema sp.]